MNFESIINAWRPLLAAAAVQVFGPWQEAVTGLNLISNYWQPQLNVASSVTGSIALAATVAFVSHRSQRARRTCFVVFILPSIIAFLVCVILNLIVGTTYFPEGTTRVFVALAWFVAYITMFTCLGAALGALALLLPKEKQ